MRTRRRNGIAILTLACAGAVACAAAQPYVKKATWHETMLASRIAARAGDKKAPAATPAGLPNFEKPVTIMAWVKTTRGGTILAKAPATGGWATGGKTLFVSGGAVKFDIGWVGCLSAGRSRVADGKWHHVALVCSPGRQQIYVDGKVVGVGTMRVTPDNRSHVVKIGFTNSGFPGPSAFTGELDEVRLYSRALSDSEIKTCFSKPKTASGPGLAGHWAFEGGGVDSSGRNNHAVKMIKTGFAAGKVGKALKLTGSGHVVLPSVDQPPDPSTYLWPRLGRDFTDDAAVQEMAWEREDGIWRGEVRADKLAGRYAQASSRSGALAERAARLARGVKTPADVAKVRDLYLQSRRRAAVLAKLGEFDLTGLRKMLVKLADQAPGGRKYVARLDALERQAAAWSEKGGIKGEDLARWEKALSALRHEALVTGNPLMNFEKLLFVKRFKYQSNHYYTDYINGCTKFGGGLCVLELKTGKVTDLAPSLNAGIFGRYDLSFDAKRVVFAWKKSPEEGFRIWEVGTDGSGLRPLTVPPDNEDELHRLYKRGYHHGTDDMDPCYLPDGGICFISTRCQYGILCDAPDIFTTTLLYRIDKDGKNMQKLTNSAVSEATPAITNDGRIMYTRWEYLDKGAVANKCLWAVRPDGTGQVEIYGNDIALPPTFMQGRPIPGSNTKFVVMGVPHYPQNGIGTVIRVDTTRNIRTREPMTYITPDIDIRGEGGFWHDRASKWGAARYFKEPYPLSESFFLVSMNQGKHYRDPIHWGLYLLNESGDAFLIHKDPAIGCFQPMPLRPRTRPAVLKTGVDAKLAKRKLAVCVVTNIYHGMEDVAPGSIKYIRVNEQVPRPWASRRRWGGDTYDQQHVCVSKDTALGLKAQHGIVPVESDGSAHFYVPADANVYFQALDANYMEVQRERTCINYRPGETRTCIGCHELPNDSPASYSKRPLAALRPPSRPGPQPGEKTGSRPLHYPTDVQPVLDKHCIKCHGGEKPKAGLDLRGTMTGLFSVSYENLVPERRGGKGRRRFALLGPTIGENHPKTGNVHYLPAKSLGSHASVLVAMLTKGMVKLADPKQAEIAAKLAKVHAKINLPAADRVRLTTWVETNAQYYGSYWGRRNLQFKDHPNFRPVPKFAHAVSYVSPLPEDKR